MADSVSAEQIPVCSPDDPDADHEWEYGEYDPSVGMMTTSKTCVMCGRTEFVDYDGDSDDYP